MTGLRAMLAVGVLTVLAGCASLSEEQCRAGDWRGIGFADGAQGRAPDHVERHQKACAKVGIAPDVQAWLAGRQEGLARYCTPSNAYDEGRRGRTIAPWCTADQRAAMQPAYERGRAYYEIGQDIDAERRDLRDLDDLIRVLPADAGSERARLFFERSRIERRVFMLENRQRRYAGWPA
jgi:hypothetical protein